MIGCKLRPTETLRTLHNLTGYRRGVVRARFAPAGEGGPALETWDVETVFWLHPRFVVDEKVETVLETWDVETVFWLHPRFVVDEKVETVLVDGKCDQVCTCTHWRSEHPAGPCSKDDSYGCACECPSFELDPGWPVVGV